MSDLAYKNHAINTTLKQVFDLMEDEELSSAKVELSEAQVWQIDRIFDLARVVSG